jgi:hypothetical protein
MASETNIELASDRYVFNNSFQDNGGVYYIIILKKNLYAIIWRKKLNLYSIFLCIPLLIFKVFAACYLPLKSIFFTFRRKIADAVSDTITCLDKFEQGVRDCLEI